MDNKKPAEKKKSSRSLKTFAIAVGVLAIAVTGGAYYFPEYLPLEQSATPAGAPPLAAKPQPVTPESAVNPAAALPAAPIVAMLSVAHATQQPEPAPVASAAVPAVQKSAEPAKPGHVAKQRPAVRKVSATKKPAPKAKKRRKTKGTAKPEYIARADSNIDPREANQEVAPPQDVLLKPAFPQPEPAHAESSPVIPVEPAPAPFPAPVETIPVAPAEIEPAQVEPATAPSVVVPKYNDLVTAVLRGDREAAKELLDLGWWVDKPSANGVTPLMAAVMNRDAVMVELLLRYGAEPTAQALSLARKNKDPATATLLEQKGAR